MNTNNWYLLCSVHKDCPPRVLPTLIVLDFHVAEQLPRFAVYIKLIKLFGQLDCQETSIFYFFDRMGKKACLIRANDINSPSKCEAFPMKKFSCIDS